jgi:ribose transport system substrate-binding protein
LEYFQGHQLSIATPDWRQTVLLEDNSKPEGKRPSTTSASYNIQAVRRACDILKCFKQGQPGLSLNDIVSKTELSRTTAFRLLATLVEEGMLVKPAKNLYRPTSQQWRRKQFRIGYASQSEEFSFSRLVSESIRSAAFEAGIELLELSNRYSSTVAIRNAENFVREGVDLVVEFQTNEDSAATVAAKLIEAGIPIIAIEIPHPGASFFGANNYRAGVMAGHALAKAAVQHWGGQVDDVILLELAKAGPLPRSRLTGILAGLRELLPKIPDQKVRFVNGNGRFETSMEATRRHLLHNKSSHVLVGALNDPNCLGALQAFEEAGRAKNCLAVSQNATIEARREMRRPGTRMVGSVAYFPERYGEAIIALALDKLEGKEIPSATFTRHQLITPENVDSYYPNDALITAGDGDSLLYSWH